MSQITGSCLCGSVKYSIDAEPAVMVNCHCEACRKASGSAFMTNMMVPEAAVTLTGETMRFEHKSDSGSDMGKVNCASCGSPIYGTNSNRPGVFVMRAGTVDSGVEYAPKANIYLDSAMPTTALDDAIGKVAKMPG